MGLAFLSFPLLTRAIACRPLPILSAGVNGFAFQKAALELSVVKCFQDVVEEDVDNHGREAERVLAIGSGVRYPVPVPDVFSLSEAKDSSSSELFSLPSDSESLFLSLLK